MLSTPSTCMSSMPLKPIRDESCELSRAFLTTKPRATWASLCGRGYDSVTQNINGALELPVCSNGGTHGSREDVLLLLLNNRKFTLFVRTFSTILYKGHKQKHVRLCLQIPTDVLNNLGKGSHNPRSVSHKPNRCTIGTYENTVWMWQDG